MYLDEIEVGLSHETRRVVTQEHIVAFAEVSGDHNPVHLDAEFAARTPFKGVIAHGMLSVGFISAVLGTALPGRGAIYMGQTLKFLAPVRPGDEVRTRVEVAEVVAEKKRVVCRTTCYVGDTVVIDGEATLMVPRRPA